MYYFDTRGYQDGDLTVVLVGCGGTGGYLAEGLMRLLPRARLFLSDPDRVEERNLLRQNFEASEVGQLKAEALARRLMRKFDRPVSYSPHLFQRMSLYSHRGMLSRKLLLIGCVDNAPARSALNDSMETGYDRPGYTWYIDAGNGDHWGQVLIGNVPRNELEGSFHPGEGLVTALPAPALQRPELLVPAPEENPDPSCAVAVETGAQSETINQAMAVLVQEVVRRMVAGTCSTMQLTLDLAGDRLTSVAATPEAVHQVTGVPVKRLIHHCVPGGTSPGNGS